MGVRRIDHVAVVVPDIEAALAFFRDALGLNLSHTEQIDEQEVLVAFLPVGDSEIELVEPVTTGSGVARYLENRGAGIHHICLEVDDLPGTLDSLKARNVELINEEPVMGSGGKRIAFIHPRSAFGVLIELVEAGAETG